jgi:hypothetical protein
MTEAQAERLLTSLESGYGGLEAFLTLPADDRATITAMLEQRAVAEEIRQVIAQCKADGTMDKIRAFVAEHQTRKIRKRD